MCGIAGFVALQENPTDKQFQFNAVQQMIGCMNARGPDAEGLWGGEGVVLGHRRLAIIDLDCRSNQPMIFATKDVMSWYSTEKSITIANFEPN